VCFHTWGSDQLIIYVQIPHKVGRTCSMQTLQQSHCTLHNVCFCGCLWSATKSKPVSVINIHRDRPTPKDIETDHSSWTSRPLKMRSTLCWNVGIQLPSVQASYPKKGNILDRMYNAGLL
jgi:hypothetical protein